MKEIGAIKTDVNSFFGDTNFTKLRSRWDIDFNLYRLKQYDAGSGYYSYTTNSPRNLAVKGISMLTESKLLIRIPDEVLQEPQLDMANNIERLHYGVLNLNNDRLMMIPDTPLTIEQMAWYSVIRGGFAVRAFVYKNDKGETIPDIAVWDLYNTAYGVGPNGVRWAANVRTVSKDYIKAEYGKDISTPFGELIDIWDENENGVIVGSEWAKEAEEHGLESPPVYICKAGAMPQVWQQNYVNANTHTGESIFASNRDIYPMISKVISDYATIVRRGVKVPLGVWSAGAVKSFDEDPYKVEQGAVIQLDSNLNEKVEPLFQPSMPVDAKDLLGMMVSEDQRGGISHVAMGELGFRLSGYAINQLTAQLSTLIVPFAVNIEKGIKLALMSIQKQYAKGGWKPIEVHGRTSRNEAFGSPEPQVITPQHINATWMPEVKLIPVLPKDDAQRYELARLALEGRMLSLTTVQDDLLGVQDPRLEQERMEMEAANQGEIMRLWNAHEAYLNQGDTERSEIILAQLKMLTAPQGPGREPKKAPGLSSSTLPSESAGGTPGGAANAQLPLFGE